MNRSNDDLRNPREDVWDAMLAASDSSGPFATGTEVQEMRAWMQSTGLWSEFTDPKNSVTLGDDL